MNINLVLQKLSNLKDLSSLEMRLIMMQLLSGDLTDSQIGAFIMAINIKGESIVELTAAAEVMRELSKKVDVSNELLLDTCGTGGVSSGIFNVSTASALLAASCGVKVAKHGNRSVTRKSGSADLLEHAGVKIALKPASITKCIDKIGIGFMFAPSHHSAMRHVSNARKELGMKTMFNVLGPLTNPAGALNQILGVYKRDLVLPIAEVLRSLGTKRAMVLHSKDGLDEISIVERTYVAELKDEKISEYEIDPKDYDFNFGSIESLKVDSPKESLMLVKEGLTGKNLIASSIIMINAGAGIYLVGLASSLKEGVEVARKAIISGQGLFKLEELVNFSNAIEGAE